MTNKLIFHNEEIVHPLTNGKDWVTKDWFGIEIPSKGIIYIPKEFVFDYASIPKILWSVLGPPATGKQRRAAMVHDWLYSSKLLSRAEADSLFLIIMKNDGVNWLKRNSLYIGVRLGGWFAWKNKNPQEINSNKFKQKVQWNENPIMASRILYA